MSYATVRAEIKAQLTATGIPIVFPYPRFAVDMATFLTRFKDTVTSRINIAWFDRVANDEDEDGGAASTGGTDEIMITLKKESWDITYLYGFHDAEEADTPSATTFQTNVEKIENQFRFLQDLNGKAWKSHPLRLLEASLRMFGDVLCHRAVFRLIVDQRVIKP
jgi:hypothetical protein